MKYIGKISFILLIVASGYTAQAQEKDAEVYWLHGWRGGSGSWKTYAKVIEDQRKVNSTRPSYGTSNGVRAGAIEFAESAGLIYNDSIRIMIAHSMGGLVARELERDVVGSEVAEAILTVATPNKGAPIASNVLNGRLDKSLKVGVDILFKGPRSDSRGLLFAVGYQYLFADLKKRIESVTGKSIDDKWKWAAFVALTYGGAGLSPNFGILEVVLNVVIGSVVESVESSLFSSVDHFLNDQRQSLIDLSPNSPFLESVNTHTQQIPMAAVICEESEGAVWRFVGSYLFKPNDQPFEQADDTKILKARNSARDIYRTAKIYNRVRRWFRWWRYGSYTRKARKWYAGEKYLSKQFEAEYYKLIGANRNQSTETFTTRLVCSGDAATNDSSSEFDFTSQPSFTGTDGCSVVKIVLHGKGRVFEKSDGFIPLSSQEMDGIPYGNRYLVKGVNHQEVANHPSITEAFNEIFNRSDAFRLEKR